MASSYEDFISLENILNVFSNPINEEQVWAVCYQCSQFYKSEQSSKNYFDLHAHGLRALQVKRDGDVFVEYIPGSENATKSGKDPPLDTGANENSTKCVLLEKNVIQSLGGILFEALDFKTDETSEAQLSRNLEYLITLMTGGGEDESRAGPDPHMMADDEGIENDTDDDTGSSWENVCTFEQIIQLCADHLSSPQNAGTHYKAVCRALVTEAQELVTFLDKITSTKEKSPEVDAAEKSRLEALHRADWARIWVRLMRELRNGIKLKTPEQRDHPAIEYEFMPFEILMDDIRSHKYTLKKIMTCAEPPRPEPLDPHAVILNFIRSRPPLRPAKDRILKTSQPTPPNRHECLLHEIKSKPTLRPRSQMVETSRTVLDLDFPMASPLPVRRLIKPDMKLLFNNSFDSDDFDDSSCDEDNNASTEEVFGSVSKKKKASTEEVFGSSKKKKVNPTVLSPMTPVSPVTSLPVTRDVTLEERRCTIQRRHSIMVCQSPTSPMAYKVPHVAQETLTEENENENIPVTYRRPIDQQNEDVIKNSNVPRNLGNDGGKSLLSELNASELMHVSWKTACTRLSNCGGTCPDCRPVPKKWKNPIECLSLTLEEVMHIRTVLTKAELESLITQRELYNQVAKGKVCFTCKETKFSLFGQWGTRCKFCKRTVCNPCLRKLNVPVDHFKNIPVYTLGPQPLDRASGDIVSYMTSTGSVPNTPGAHKKSPQRRPLQRSQTLRERVPTANLSHMIKSPEMNICRDCKKMVTEIIHAGRTSINLLNSNREPVAVKKPTQLNIKQSHVN